MDAWCDVGIQGRVPARGGCLRVVSELGGQGEGAGSQRRWGWVVGSKSMVDSDNDTSYDQYDRHINNYNESIGLVSRP